MCMIFLVVYWTEIWSQNTTSEADIKADYEYYHGELKEATKKYIETYNAWLVARHQ